MDDLLKLDDRALPPQEVFYSRLKNEGTSDEDYTLCQVAWCDNGMKTMRDFLVLVGLPANAKHRRTWKSSTYEMF